MPRGRGKKTIRRAAARKIQRAFRKRNRRKAIKNRSVIPRPLKCFPNSMKFNMRYCDVVTIPNHNVGSGPYVFRMNSIFDPDHTSVGHQPRFHDQIGAIYHKYCVIGAKAYIEVLTTSPSTNSEQGNPTIFAYLDDSATADSRSLEQHIELGMPNSSYLMTNVPGQSFNGPELSRAKRSFTMTYGVRKFWGIDKKTQLIYPSGTGVGDEYIENSNYSAMYGTNPTRVCFLKLKTFDSAVTDTTVSFKARVTIDYTVVCYQPIEVGAS